MIECPHCGQVCKTPGGLTAHLRGAHGTTRPGDPLDPVPTVSVSFSTREWTLIERIAKSQNITCTAVVRAAVQRVLAANPPAAAATSATKRGGCPS
jgi:hypothetical protein